MQEETVVVENDVKKQGGLNENTSTEEILKQSPDAQAEAKAAEESSTSKEQTDETGEVVKTQEEDNVSVEEKEESELLAKNQAIPYQRFQKTIQQRNELKTKIQELEQEREERERYLSDPDVLRVVLSKQGKNEAEIKSILQENGIVDNGNKVNSQGGQDDITKQLGELAKDLDLNTVEGWGMYQYRIAQLAAENKAKEQITAYDKSKSDQENIKTFITEQEKQAKKLSEETYKIPYGESGKDERNPKTAIGKIAQYLKNNPRDASLGQVKLLRLAMSEEGFKLGESKGIDKEKKRQLALKSAAVESENVSAVDESQLTPADMADWPTSKIIEWHQKYRK